MSQEDEALPQPIRGALWYLKICGRAVGIQEQRLLREHGDNTVDLWLTLVALRNAVWAVRLAIRVAPDPEPLRQTFGQFEGSKAAGEIRNVFEHFDEYFFGEGKLQRGQPEPGLVTPRIGILHAADEMSVTVKVAGYELRIPEATKAADDLLWDVRKLLRQQAGVAPF